MSSFLLFVMVAAMFVHTFMNFFLTVASKVASKISGGTVVLTEHSVEAFFANVFAGIFNWFKSL